MLQIESVKPMLDIAHQLDIPAGEQAIHIVRLRRHGETPVMVTEAWVPAAIGHNITSQQLQERALFEILIDHFHFAHFLGIFPVVADFFIDGF